MTRNHVKRKTGREGKRDFKWIPHEPIEVPLSLFPTPTPTVKLHSQPPHLILHSHSSLHPPPHPTASRSWKWRWGCLCPPFQLLLQCNCVKAWSYGRERCQSHVCICETGGCGCWEKVKCKSDMLGVWIPFPYHVQNCLMDIKWRHQSLRVIKGNYSTVWLHTWTLRKNYHDSQPCHSSFVSMRAGASK